MLDAGVPLVSMQVQYSLLDRRPEARLVPLGQQRGVQLLCYGTLAGGFFSERWLGAPEPSELTNRSLIKYKLVIDDCGGWSAFQSLLQTLKSIAERHHTSIAAVATRWVLDRPGVAAAIVGARYADHLNDTLAVFSLRSRRRPRVAGAVAGGPSRTARRHLRAGTRQERPPRPDHEVQPQQDLKELQRCAPRSPFRPSLSLRLSCRCR